MSYKKVIGLLEEMRNRADSNGFSSSDKDLIKSLYFEVCGKHVRDTSCSDCYKDAYIETYTALKRKGKMVKRPNYILKAGVVISRFSDNNFYALSNCPDDVAEDWLKEDHSRINLFEAYPDDWEKRISKADDANNKEVVEQNASEVEPDSAPVTEDAQNSDETQSETTAKRGRKATK